MTRNTEGYFEEAHATLAHGPDPRSSPISNTEDYVRVDQIAENLGIPESTPSGHLRS